MLPAVNVGRVKFNNSNAIDGFLKRRIDGHYTTARIRPARKHANEIYVVFIGAYVLRRRLRPRNPVVNTLFSCPEGTSSTAGDTYSLPTNSSSGRCYRFRRVWPKTVLLRRAHAMETRIPRVFYRVLFNSLTVRVIPLWKGNKRVVDCV